MNKQFFNGVAEIQNFIRWLNCLSAEKIETIFGSDHFAYKFLVYFERDAGRFITSLDSNNLRLLVVAFIKATEPTKGGRDA